MLPTGTATEGGEAHGESGLTHPDYAKWMLEDPRMNFASCCAK